LINKFAVFTNACSKCLGKRCHESGMMLIVTPVEIEDSIESLVEKHEHVNNGDTVPL
jgi:hypothetical protein